MERPKSPWREVLGQNATERSARNALGNVVWQTAGPSDVSLRQGIEEFDQKIRQILAVRLFVYTAKIRYTKRVASCNDKKRAGLRVFVPSPMNGTCWFQRRFQSNNLFEESGSEMDHCWVSTRNFVFIRSCSIVVVRCLQIDLYIAGGS